MKKPGFTLAEVLIALAILGVIATFVIPKILYVSSLQQRYTKAQDALATLSQLNQQYLLENGGCYQGDIACKINPATGAPLDGKSNISYYNNTPDAYDKLTAWLDTHLNYVARKDTSYGTVIYQLHNNVIFEIWGIVTNYEVNPGQYEVLFLSGINVGDRTLDQVEAGEYSMGGVDSSYADIYIFRSGVAFGGANTQLLRSDQAYDPALASIFDWKEHPDDTCVAIGGFQCDM